MKSKDQGVTQGAGSEYKIHFSQLAAYGAGGIIPIALFNVAGILVGLMGNISLGLSAFWLGTILIIPRLWDAVSDPIIGHLSDNTRTRWGRRRPFLLAGGILVAVTFVIMWWIPKGEMVHAWFPSEASFQWFQLGYILVTLLMFYTACTIFEIPHGALGMEMTEDYHERTRLFSAKSFVGNLFAMSTPWLFALANMEVFKGVGGNEADGMRYVSLLIAAILIPLSFWWFRKLREPGFIRVKKQEKTDFWQDMRHTASNRNFIMLTLTIFTLAMGFNFVNLLGSYIPIFYVFEGDKVAGAYLLGINGTIWAITGVLAVFPLNWISPKIGKRNTLIIAILLMCLAQLSKIVCYNPDYPYLIIIPTILLSTGMLFFFTLGASMVGDICDEDDLKTGTRTEGSFYSVFWWFIKMGTALASFVAGILIVFTAFDQTQVTKVDSLQGPIREMRAKVQFWGDVIDKDTASWNSLKEVRVQAEKDLEVSKTYLVYLRKESDKMQQNDPQATSEYQSQKSAKFTAAIDQTRMGITELEAILSRPEIWERQYPDSASSALLEDIRRLSLRTDILKAEMASFELMSHLAGKSADDINNSAHYADLIGISSTLYARVSTIDASSPPQTLDNELGLIEKDIVPLTRQSPYTLLMMRIVEIGLPLLLSIFSIFFVLRYTLTEKRSRQVQEQLRERNIMRS